MSTLASQLRMWRGVAGEPPRGAFSQAAAAEHLGVNLDTYQNWEQGRRVPPAYALPAIREALKRTPAGALQEKPRKGAHSLAGEGRRRAEKSAREGGKASE